jgi:hypothetical protein
LNEAKRAPIALIVTCIVTLIDTFAVTTCRRRSFGALVLLFTLAGMVLCRGRPRWPATPDAITTP